jgi:hypothetical protein
MDKISKFGGKCALPSLGKFFGAVKMHTFKKIGKIHQYSYFGTIYSKKKRKPRSIKERQVGLLYRQLLFIFINIFKKYVFRFFVAVSKC